MMSPTRDLYVMMNDDLYRVWRYKGTYFVDEVWDMAYTWHDLYDCNVQVVA